MYETEKKENIILAIKLFCDSNCELWYIDIERLDLGLLEMPYILDGQVYGYDCGKTTDFDAFYARMREGGMPTTSALNEFYYTEAFEPIFAGGDDIFYISFSSQLSATFNFLDSAVKALLEKYPERKFERFDTKGISVDCGYQVYFAVEYFRQGHSLEETKQLLEYLRENVVTLFAVADLNHLKRGGRVSALSAAFGSMLQIKPILHISEEGRLEVADKVKGQKKVLSYFVSKIEELCDDDKLAEGYPIRIIHGDDMEKAEELKAKILQSKPNANVEIAIVGPVIASHCGPGTLAISFLKK